MNTATLRLHPASTILTAITAWTLVTTMLVFRATGLSVSPVETLQPLALCVGLALAAAYYSHRGVPSFSLCLEALIFLVGFSAIFSVLVYGVGAGGRPLADSTLAACDSSLGISAGKISVWVNAHTWLSVIFKLTYFSAIPQTILAIVVLGFTNDAMALRRLLTGFMLCGLVTVACFYFAPALGTVADRNVPVPAHYEAVLRDLTALRDGSMRFVTWKATEGLITWPSFHAQWGILLVLAFRKTRIAMPMLVLNGIMILSAVTTGMHYATDVIGGVVVCLIVVPVSIRVLRWHS